MFLKLKNLMKVSVTLFFYKIYCYVYHCPTYELLLTNYLFNYNYFADAKEDIASKCFLLIVAFDAFVSHIVIYLAFFKD